MLKTNQIYQKLKNNPVILNYKNRRQLITMEMKSLNQKGINCNNCQGNCCTFQSNSMQIDPLETFEIIKFLEENRKIDHKFEDMLKQNIEEFRLNSFQYIRKTYTCPFFNHTHNGCLIGKYHKPYGCLAFNPTEKVIDKGSTCRSKQSILKNRNKIFNKSEQAFIQQIKKEIALSWDKLPIPLALLDMIQKISNCPRKL